MSRRAQPRYLDDDIDFFRMAYEDLRLGTPIDGIAYQAIDQISYERGVAFGDACVAAGYGLEPWPSGQPQPPRKASAAFRRANRSAAPRTNRSTVWRVPQEDLQ